MEYLWYIIAALAAGVGTGLAGLSAATVMVPVLIVMCPSFAGETGTYQATAIALMSDILGSAVTAWTYYKHRNMDLKRARIVLVCVLIMCTVGSWVAFIVGNVALSSFTLFLTFCIGIRFLVKPDTGKADGAPKGARLDGKAVAWSLFWGLSVGFGTGFVGTGGGMIMLIVFTVFLGMTVRTAVGTSTFIMTFTALIASVSHVLIHPAIILDRWPVVLVCASTATAASLFSARFANRVKNRTVSLVTGGVLTVLGAAMLILYYRDALASVPLITDTLKSLGVFLACVIPALIVLVPVRRFTSVPSFVFRKLLHIMAFTFAALMIWTCDGWPAAVLAPLIAAAAIFPVLTVFQRRPWYAHMLVQKSPGEVRRSMVMIFFATAAVAAVAWGVFGKKLLAAAAILMWGVGDGAAALVGIPFGKHKVHLRGTDGKKSWEGSLAMLLVSALCGTLVLFLRGGYALSRALGTALFAAFAGAAAELFSPGEYDTLTVPAAVTAALLAASAFLPAG